MLALYFYLCPHTGCIYTFLDQTRPQQFAFVHCWLVFSVGVPFFTSHWVYLRFLPVSLFMGFRFVSFSVSARKCFQLSWLYSAQIKGNRPADPPNLHPCLVSLNFQHSLRVWLTVVSSVSGSVFYKFFVRYIYIYIYSLLSPSCRDLVPEVLGLLRELGHVWPRGGTEGGCARRLDICDLNISELIYQIKAGLLIQATEHRNLSANMAAHTRRLTQTHTGHTHTLTHTHTHADTHTYSLQTPKGIN